MLSTIGIVPVVLALWMMNDSPTAGSRRRGILLALGSGIVSCLGNIAYFDVFSRGTKAAAVIPITALYPAVTVLLAIPLLKERLNRWQVIGIGLSLGAIYSVQRAGWRGRVFAMAVVCTGSHCVVGHLRTDAEDVDELHFGANVGDLVFAVVCTGRGAHHAV